MSTRNLFTVASIIVGAYVGYTNLRQYGPTSMTAGILGGAYIGSYLPKATEAFLIAVGLPIVMALGIPIFDDRPRHGYD